MTDIRNNMIFDEAEIEVSLAKSKVSKADPRICVCGHNARSHASQGVEDSPLRDLFESRGVEACSPARQTCPCNAFRAVAESDNVRLFIFKTTGAYNSHALNKGISAAIKKGVDVRQIGDWACDACQRTLAVDNVKVGPVPLDSRQREVFAPGEYNLLLCGDCATLLRRGELFSQ